MVRLCVRIRDAAWFQNFIIAVIIFAGVVVGMETYPYMVEHYGVQLHFLDNLILGIFVVEIIIKMTAEGKKPWRYFYDPWNVFDFIIVAVCFVPGMGEYAMVMRLVRLLRVLRLVTAIPRLQLLVGALLRSLPSMVYVSILLSMLFYIYAVAAVFLFGENDPIHFGNLQISLLSLFRVVTLEDWTDIMYIQMYGCDFYGYQGYEQLCTAPEAMPIVGSLFFVSFVLMGTMVFLNLFIGVIINGMDEAAADLEMQQSVAEAQSIEGVYVAVKKDEITMLQDQLEEMQRRLRRIKEESQK